MDCTGEDVAWEKIRSKLQEVIAAEDKAKPLSDEEIVKSFAEDGLTVVAKTDLDPDAVTTANALRELGVRQGDRVLCWLPNSADCLRAWMGLNYLGATFVPINLAYRGNILAHVLKLSEARLGICCFRYRPDGMPDGAALGRTQAVLEELAKKAKETPGVDQVITIAGISALDNNATLANAGLAYIVLKDWAERGKGEDLPSLYKDLNANLGSTGEARVIVLPPPAIQGIGNAAGFTMQIELRDGSFDLAKLQGSLNAVVETAETQSGIQRISAPFRSSVPQYKVEVDREKVQALGLTTDQVFSTLASYLGSSYVNQFNKFGRVFQVYVQGDAQYRLTPESILTLTVRNKNGDMIPLGTMMTITPSVGPALISLYNLYPSASVIGVPNTGFSSGDAIKLMEQIAADKLPPGTGTEWTALSYQEKIVGGQLYLVFGLALLLVYLVLAGQYESWYLPVAVLLAAPLSLVGPVSVLAGLHIDNNLYVQIGLILLIGNYKTAARLQAGGNAFLESPADGIYGGGKQLVVEAHVCAVVGLRVEQLTELFIGHRLTGAELPEDFQDLFGLRERETHRAVVQHVNQVVRLERVDGVAALRLALLFQAIDDTRRNDLLLGV